MHHSQDSEVWRVLSTNNEENRTQGQGVPDRRVLRISTAQCFQAVLSLSKSKGGLALWSLARAPRSLVQDRLNLSNLRIPPILAGRNKHGLGVKGAISCALLFPYVCECDL